MQAILVMFKSDGTRKDFTIKSDRKYIIGRKETSDLRIPMTNVSREHAAIYFDNVENELVIEDLGSSNGTYVNNEKIDNFDLCPGDVIVVGSIPLQVVINGHPSRIKPIQMQDIIEGSDPDKAGAADAVTFIADTQPQETVPKDEIDLANDHGGGSDGGVRSVGSTEGAGGAGGAGGGVVDNDAIDMPDESGSFFDFDVSQDKNQ